MERANRWAVRRGLDARLHYRVANGAISLPSLLSTYPGPVSLVCVQVCAPRDVVGSSRSHTSPKPAVLALVIILHSHSHSRSHASIRTLTSDSRDMSCTESSSRVSPPSFRQEVRDYDHER